MAERPAEDGDVLHGVIAEFETPEELLVAARAAYEVGYRRMDAYSPFPVEGLAEAIGEGPSRLPWLALAGAAAGGCGAYFMQYFSAVHDYPLNIGGRPFHSWPAFIPITFEMTILATALTIVVSLFALTRLPTPYHPVFNAPHFERASQDRFFLCLEAEDPKFDRDRTREFLRSIEARQIFDVPE